MLLIYVIVPLKTYINSSNLISQNINSLDLRNEDMIFKISFYFFLLNFYFFPKLVFDEIIYTQCHQCNELLVRCAFSAMRIQCDMLLARRAFSATGFQCDALLVQCTFSATRFQHDTLLVRRTLVQHTFSATIMVALMPLFNMAFV